MVMQKAGSGNGWETVVTRVVDFALTLPQTDPDRIVLIGYSMGGYLAPRAAAYEQRLWACVVNGGIYSVYESASSDNPPITPLIIEWTT